MATTAFKYLPLLLALLLGQTLADQAPTASASTPSQAQPASESSPVIKLFKKKKDDGTWPLDCTIPFPASGDKTIKFADNNSDTYGCTNDDDYGFKIENAPSAAEIELWENNDCNDQNDWVFYLKTINNPTHMTEEVDIQRLDALTPPEPDSDDRLQGVIVVPGLKLMKKYNDGNEVGGKLSCIQIKTSPKP